MLDRPGLAFTKLPLLLGLSAAMLLAGCGSDDSDDNADAGTEGDGDGDASGDGDGDAEPKPSSCTLLSPPIAQASFETGTSATLATPDSIHMIGQLSGGTGPYVATWAGAKNQFFESPELPSSPAQWEADFEYSQATGWPDQCPADAPICAKSDELSFSIIDDHTSEAMAFPLFAQASLCVDLNRSSPVCPLPVVIDSVTATPDPGDPATLEFRVTLVHPELDCSGMDAADGLSYRWAIDDGGEGLEADSDVATLSFARPNVSGRYFHGSVEVLCSKTYDAEGSPAVLDLRASTEFYVDCQ